MDKKKNIFGVHASYSKSKKVKGNDLVIVKERLGDEKSLRFFYNYQRDFYVTKKKYQNHKCKKVQEELAKLDRFSCTQANLERRVAKALFKRPDKMRTLARSQFLYGTDVHVNNIIMQKYRESFGQPEQMPDVGVADFEWDVDDGNTTIGTYSDKKVAFAAVREDLIKSSGFTTKSFIKAVEDGYKEKVVPILMDFFLRNPKLDVFIPKLELETTDLDINILRKTFRITHRQSPDYLAFWNGEADMDMAERVSAKYGVELSSYMNDPRIPEEYRHTKFNRGAHQTIDANGNPKFKQPSQRWHTLDNMASWHWIDLMCAYRSNRVGANTLPSYSMFYILNKELGLGKLSLIPELEKLHKDDAAEWHRRMSRNHIVEYTLYAIFDVIGPMLLEHKNFEISSQTYSNINVNPIGDFKKNPRKLANKNHFKFLKRGYVIASTSDQMTEELDKLIYGADGMIITLNGSYHDGLRTRACSDIESVTLFMPSNDDGDLTSSYPSNQRLTNSCKTTTFTEIIKAYNIPKSIMLECGMDLTSHADNHIDFAVRILGLPHIEELTKLFQNFINDLPAANDDVKDEAKAA